MELGGVQTHRDLLLYNVLIIESSIITGFGEVLSILVLFLSWKKQYGKILLSLTETTASFLLHSASFA